VETRDVVTTRTNLMRRGVTVTSNLCPLCKKVEETVQHILTSCEVGHKVWDKYNRWLGVSSVRHNNIVDHF